MDNMRVHRSKLAQEAFTRLNILPIFNIPYCPQYNGIESVFSVLKEKYKRAMMEKIVKGERFRPQELIKSAIHETSPSKVANCIKHSIEDIMS